MFDLICDVINCSVWSCDMGKINVHDEIMIETEKKEIMEITVLEWNSQLRWEDTSFTACDAYRYFAGKTWLMTSQSRSHTENINNAETLRPARGIHKAHCIDDDRLQGGTNRYQDQLLKNQTRQKRASHPQISKSTDEAHHVPQEAFVFIKN